MTTAYENLLNVMPLREGWTAQERVLLSDTTLDGKQTTALNIFWEPEDTISFMEEALVGNVLMRFAFLMILLPIFDLF